MKKLLIASTLLLGCSVVQASYLPKVVKCVHVEGKRKHIEDRFVFKHKGSDLYQLVSNADHRSTYLERGIYRLTKANNSEMVFKNTARNSYYPDVHLKLEPHGSRFTTKIKSFLNTPYGVSKFIDIYRCR